MGNDIDRLNRELGQHAMALVGAFGIPEHLQYSPIANDWEKYNDINREKNYMGEVFEAVSEGGY